MKHPGWLNISLTTISKCGVRWRHIDSGWEVWHCGHPTANWPYHLVDPAEPARVTVSHNGRGFRSLHAAMAVVQRIVWGQLVVTNDQCTDTTRRVLVQANGDPLVEPDTHEAPRDG